MMDIINPLHYKNSLEKYKIEDKNMLSNNYSAVIALVTFYEKYNLEKAIGTNAAESVWKKNLENYVC